jgi:hypothetical protein
MGIEEFDYDSFKMSYDEDPVIQALTHRFDDNGVELASKNTRASTAPSDADPERSSIKQAAKRATTRARG